MQKILGAVVVLLIMVGNFSYAIADDFSISVGLKSWYNWMSLPSIEDSTGKDIGKTSAALMVGPTIKAQNNNMYAGISFLVSTNDYEVIDYTEPTSWGDYNLKGTASRNDFDIFIGYMLTPRFAVNAGYKGIFMSMKLDATLGSIFDANAKNDLRYNLGALGVGGNIPIGEKIIVFINGNALLGTIKADETYSSNWGQPDRSENATAWGGSAEIGGAYLITTNLSVNIGFKYQYLDDDMSELSDGDNDVQFYGLTMGMEYRF
ncbi:MAG: hypothetical protein A2511_14895 [Deltaproteobacteria bacterium RIFOXYD12_FULL_50_9]|nr:MAG: hypothetical protein A2511_14895 [Deltaproteobacteria bacterium RIFOXYD12_FULL_50_9]